MFEEIVGYSSVHTREASCNTRSQQEFILKEKNSMSSSVTVVRSRIWAVVFLLFASSSMLFAQPRLNFSAIRSHAFPDVKLFFQVRCNGNLLNQFSKKNITLKEDGELINDFTLTNFPDTATCFSVALVLERSGGQSLPDEKTGAKVFIDSLDGTCDEASLLSFAGDVTVDVFMTTDKNLLKTGIDAMVGGGTRALWDAVGAGILELKNNGVHSTRFVIVVADGKDYASTRYTRDDCIELATKNDIRIFTIGFGNDVFEPPLQEIARRTMGTYYHAPSGDKLIPIFQEIYALVSRVYRECSIAYKSSCPDGTTRTVELTVGAPFPVDNCAGTDTKVKIFRAPLDATTFKEVRVAVANTVTSASGPAKVPLVVMDSVNGTLTPSSVHVRFDPACAKYVSIDTRGQQLEGVPISFSPTMDGVMINFEGEKDIPGDGVLAMLTFVPADTTGQCRECSIQLEGWDLKKCIQTVLSAGSVTFGTPTLALNEPQAGVAICPGTDVNVQWSSTCLENVDVFVSDNSGGSWKLVADDIPASTGKWIWTVTEDAGMHYRVRLVSSTNPWLSTQTAGDFIINSLPHVEKQPLGLVLMEGKSGTMRSQASGSPTALLQWQVSTDGGKTFADISNQIDRALQLKSVTAEMNGYLYRARFYNECGSVYSLPARLRVIPRQWVTVAPDVVSICAGSQAKLISRAMDTVLFRQWQRADPGSAVFQDIPGETGDTLVVNPSSVGMSGTQYRVRAGSPRDTAFSTPALLVVQGVPVIMSPPSSTASCFGDSVALSVSAINATSYQWRKGGVDIPGATSSFLLLKALSPSDTGSYSVVLTNKCGSVETVSARLLLMEAPMIREQPVSRSASPGERVRFKVHATGQALTYQWWKDGVILPGATDSTLVINQVQKSDEGAYVAVVRNKCGEALSDTVYLSVTLTAVRGTPEAANSVILFQNFPNPLGGAAPDGDRQTAIGFALPENGHVVLRVFTIRGEEIAALVNRTLESGRHLVRLDARNLRPGVYYYRLEFTPVDGRRIPVVQTKKLVIMR